MYIEDLNEEEAAAFWAEMGPLLDKLKGGDQAKPKPKPKPKPRKRPEWITRAVAARFDVQTKAAFTNVAKGLDAGTLRIDRQARGPIEEGSWWIVGGMVCAIASGPDSSGRVLVAFANQTATQPLAASFVRALYKSAQRGRTTGRIVAA